jgi:RNA-binding protein
MDAASKKNLKAEAHVLKPVVTVGQAGLTAAVLAEIENALTSHELLKIKIRAEKIEREAFSGEICKSTGAELIQMIGQITVIYRKKPKTIAKKKPKPVRHKPRK